MNIYFLNFGCKVNAYELEAIKQDAARRGHSEALVPEEADAAVINSCAVTEEAAKKCRSEAKSIRRRNPDCAIAVIGCCPQAFFKSGSRSDLFDIALGTKNKSEVISALEGLFADKGFKSRIDKFSIGDKIDPLSISDFSDHTRAILKIEDGCDMYCSYCIIPYARGHVRSKTPDAIKKEAAALAENGHKELVLVGINLCCWGKELGLRLTDAIKAVSEVMGIERIRLGSLEPELITREDILKMAKIKKLCPHFHLSLQSGCDKTLARMKRRYDTAYYRELTDSLRSEFENPSITTDVMVGFPGETEEDFLQSVEFVKKIGFAGVHVFPYSERQGTAACKLPEKTDGKTKKERAKIMREAALVCQRKFLESQVGTLQEVIFERESDPVYHVGHTANYTKVKILRKNAKNKLHKRRFCVRIKEASASFCLGEIEREIL